MQEITTLEVGGTPRERGRQYGAGLKALIRARDAAWRRSLETQTGRPADAVISDLVHGTDFLPVIERHTPDLLEEVRGVADGAGLSFEAIYAAQLMDEEWWIIANAKATASLLEPRRHRRARAAARLSRRTWISSPGTRVSRCC